MKKEFIDYLNDIIFYAKEAESFIQGMSFEEFISDNKTKFAVYRALEIIGEASKKIPGDFKKKNPDVPWKSIAGMRDKLIHDYTGIDYNTVWKTIHNNLPQLRSSIEKMIDAYYGSNPIEFNNN